MRWQANWAASSSSSTRVREVEGHRESRHGVLVERLAAGRRGDGDCYSATITGRNHFSEQLQGQHLLTSLYVQERRMCRCFQ